MNKVQVAKVAAKSLGELSESGKDLFCSMKGTAHEAAASQKLLALVLWRLEQSNRALKTKLYTLKIYLKPFGKRSRICAKQNMISEYNCLI
jgi:hypothetical protein